jgi:type I restriction enzyme, S subunit
MNSNISKKNKIEDICKKITDGSHYSPKSVNNGYPMASVKDLTYFDIKIDQCRRIPEKEYQKIVNSDCKPLINDVLVAKDGSYLKNIIVIKEERDIVVLSSIAILRPDLEKVNPLYLKYYLLNPNSKRRIKQGYASGSALPRITLKDLKQFKVDLKPFPEQDKIALILSTLDDNIELNNQMNKNLEELAQAIFKHWFVDFEFPDENGEPYKSTGGEMVESELGHIPKGWRVAKLGSLLKEIGTGNRPKGGISKYREGIPSIGAENINGLCNYDFSKTKYVPKAYYNEMRTGIIRNGDILLYKDGAKLGRKSMVLEDYPFKKCCVNSHVFILRSNIKIRQSYLFFFLDQDSTTQSIINLNTNSAQPGINRTSVKTLKILLPYESILISFDNLVFPILRKIFNNGRENKYLSDIRDTILPKLMSGEILVPVEKLEKDN